ncbi:helix-turn-helix domain-containing protein [Bacteroidales bacterium OttesenSCG-928-K22]|nr:helix-turn-helix domain-containing protein [Bacteroidales bacterium OttesenSCG-928-L14]MDL2240197.1 helix-turn-helix domain-containing protein [Bacteroidales bacterium OttesenSCG-928-K22]
MDVIIMESKAYKELVDKINSIAEFVEEHQVENSINLEEEWVDSYEVCTFLNISQRTLQRLRTKGLISYSLISGKTYYTIAEIKRVLNERLIKSKQEALEDLINNHKLYAQQRRIAKKNK